MNWETKLAGLKKESAPHLAALARIAEEIYEECDCHETTESLEEFLAALDTAGRAFD